MNNGIGHQQNCIRCLELVNEREEAEGVQKKAGKLVPKGNTLGRRGEVKFLKGESPTVRSAGQQTNQGMNDTRNPAGRLGV